MKVALTHEGIEVVAQPSAPEKAICPNCGGELLLRSRRQMNNGGCTYFWRHKSNHNRHCSARNCPISAWHRPEEVS